MKKAELPFPFPLTAADIRQRRASILVRLCAEDAGFARIPVCRVAQRTLADLLAGYDSVFLGGFLRRTMPFLSVTLSTRLTSAAGKFLCTYGPFGRIQDAEIRMSADYLLRLADGPFLLNGLSVATPQEAFLVVFEHELCHALEMAFYGKTGHSAAFLALANGLFGHTAMRHSLPTRRQEAAKDGLFVGSQVCFTHNGAHLRGAVTYIGKLATVMVPAMHGPYRDRRGRRYEKYRVPLDRLRHDP